MSKKRKIEVFSAGCPACARDHQPGEPSGVPVVRGERPRHERRRRREPGQGAWHSLRASGRHRRQARRLLCGARAGRGDAAGCGGRAATGVTPNASGDMTLLRVGHEAYAVRRLPAVACPVGRATCRTDPDALRHEELPIEIREWLAMGTWVTSSRRRWARASISPRWQTRA